MGRCLRWVVALFALLAVVVLARDAGAKTFEEQVRDLASSDPKIRTVAALALGASDLDAAVTPLCGAINDSSETVRQAVAIALKRLRRAASLGCLKARANVETVNSVKLQITRAIESIEGEAKATPAPAPRNGNAKFYLSLKVNNQTGRADAESKFQAAFRDNPGSVQLAPPGESREAAEAAIKSRNLSGYQMSISLEKFDGSGGNLTLRVRVAYATYPALNIIAMSSGSLQAPGAQPGNSSAENELISGAAQNAPQQFRDFLTKNGKSP